MNNKNLEKYVEMYCRVYSSVHDVVTRGKANIQNRMEAVRVPSQYAHSQPSEIRIEMRAMSVVTNAWCHILIALAHNITAEGGIAVA